MLVPAANQWFHCLPNVAVDVAANMTWRLVVVVIYTLYMHVFMKMKHSVWRCMQPYWTTYQRLGKNVMAYLVFIGLLPSFHKCTSFIPYNKRVFIKSSLPGGFSAAIAAIHNVFVLQSIRPYGRTIFQRTKSLRLKIYHSRLNALLLLCPLFS